MDADPSFDQLRHAVCDAVEDLYNHDSEILGTTERVVVGRLMIYLNRHLGDLSRNGLVLDQEYERAGEMTKRLAGTEDAPDRKIVPDMIFHRRHDASPSGNLLAIEVKTVAGEYGRLHDFAKLSVLTGHAKHAIAYKLCLRLEGEDAPRGQDRVGLVGLDDKMQPYKYGLWLLVRPERNQSQYWWWSNGGPPEQLPCGK